MLTQKQIKALQILEQYPGGLTARQFAQLYFTDKEHEYLFTAVSNQGNGACAGKKAWLCAGSLLGKLAKKGLVGTVFKGARHIPNRHQVQIKYYITTKLAFDAVRIL